MIIMKNIIINSVTRNKYLTDNNFEKAKSSQHGRKTIKDEWDNIEVLNYSFEKAGR